jgi:hypothetical protein
MDEIFQKTYDLKNEILDSQKKIGEVLYYLELSERYKEDKRYENCSFDEFLLNEFGYSYSQYKKILRANERNEIYWC